MELNCGTILTGEASIADKGEELFQLILETASGKRSCSEQHGYGHNESVPWQIGAIT